MRGIGSGGQILIDVEREAFRLHTEGEDRRLAVTPGEGLYDCIGPIDAVLAAARGDQFVNQSPTELGARTVEALDIAYRNTGPGAVAYRAQVARLSLGWTCRQMRGASYRGRRMWSAASQCWGQTPRSGSAPCRQRSGPSPQRPETQN